MLENEAGFLSGSGLLFPDVFSYSKCAVLDADLQIQALNTPPFVKIHSLTVIFNTAGSGDPFNL